MLNAIYTEFPKFSPFLVSVIMLNGIMLSIVILNVVELQYRGHLLLSLTIIIYNRNMFIVLATG
jgi:hypothetical protein